MNYNYIILYFTIFFVNILHILGYRELSCNKEININFKKILILFIISFFIMYNCLVNTGITKPLISYSCLVILYYFVFKSKYNDLLSCSIINYIYVVFTEIILSVILIITEISSYDLFESEIFVKSFFSFITVFIALILCRLKISKKIANKISSLINKSKIVPIILVISMFIPIILDFKYLNNVNIVTYLIDLVLFIIFEVIISFLIYYEIKIGKEIDKYENLLKFISKYEKIIDDQRIGRHEIHNNLLILKSYKNKNSKEFNEILDSYINYYSKTEDSIKNMNKLPNGIKGMVYYKLSNIESNNIKLNFNISKQVKFSILKNNKDYFVLCKILGIVLDNAIEAATDSRTKILSVDIYSNNKSIYFNISNSYNKRKFKYNDLKNRKFSTKGKNRGYGLLIANKLSSSSEHINFKQYLENDFFVSLIEVNK